MSYVANNYNYATPLSSVAGLVGESSAVTDKKYFTLSDNVLDGSYAPITGDVGLWGAAASDASGVLSAPFVATVTETLTMNAFRLVGSQYCYPVAFTVKLYNGTTLLRTITETANNKVEYIYYLSQTLNVTSYEVSITKVSKPGSAARLYNLYNPAYVKRVDTLRVKQDSTDVVGLLFSSTDRLSVKSSDVAMPIAPHIYGSDSLKVKETNTDIVNVLAKAFDTLIAKETSVDTVRNTIDKTFDTLRVKHTDKSAILNTIDVTRDRLSAKLVERISHVLNTIDVTRDTLKVKQDTSDVLTNVHTRMKDPFRRIYGKVYITYTDPMLDTEMEVVSEGSAYNSEPEQTINSNIAVSHKYFTLYDNDLSGSYVVSGPDSEVGWTSGDISDANGEFSTPQSMSVKFSSRPIIGLTVYFDDSHGSVAKDFVVTFTKEDGTTQQYVFTDNADATVRITDDNVANVVSVTLSVTKVTKPYAPVTVLELPVSSTLLYRGYQDVSELMSVDLLEELTYEDDVEALGGVSANEITVVLDNSDRAFFFNNTQSLVARQLKRNRKIVPWLGVEVVPGEIEWYTLGTFWSYKWDVPVNGLTASVVGFDTIGLLGNTDYIEHQVLTDKSIGELIEYVLEDAKLSFDFLEYIIDPALYDIIIPYAWFNASNHADALRKISMCYPMHIYCDRQGRICAAPQKLRLDFYYDTWSDSTNVVDKNYSSLYTVFPNIVNVTVRHPVPMSKEQIANENELFVVSGSDTKTLSFSEPYVSDISVTVDCDSTLSYTYKTYSWGVVFTFVGDGTVSSISCDGTVLDTSHSTIVTRRKEDSVRLEGAVKRDVTSDFIQRPELANAIIDRIFTLSENDKYDATVNYRGDIALSINDPILLNDGIAPDNRYNIRRHQLSWNGALTGSADLNT